MLFNFVSNVVLVMFGGGEVELWFFFYVGCWFIEVWDEGFGLLVD